jgi:predicted enzyme related to lactoylglutathione lyase
LGAKVKMPPTTVEGMGRFAVIQDPTDAHIALWESAIP